MGQSTDGQICYGIIFEEGYEFPWIKEDEEFGSIEDWWLEQQSFKPKHPIYNESGEWIHIRKPTEEEYDVYFTEVRAFQAEHPLPIAEVNYCSGDYPMYILAVPSTLKEASRGNPKEFDPKDLTVTDCEKQALIDFCTKYNLEGSEPKWWLSSYWG